VLADGWYGWVVEGFVPLTDLIERWPRRWRDAVGRTGALRGAVLFLFSIGYDRVVVIRNDPGWRSLLLLRAVFGRRHKLVAAHFIDHGPRRRWRGRLIDLAWRPVDRWATRRALAVGQVLSVSEAELYARRFGVGADRFALVPFAWRMTVAGAPFPSRRAPGERIAVRVISAGRAGCDWPVLFAAARGADWQLTVVCAGHDLDEVLRLNAGGPARVLVDISHDDARALLRESDVSVIAMLDGELSHGHVRCCDAVDAGAAIVASRVRSLEGYVEDGETALLVPPRDPAALRLAVDRLVDDPELRVRLARSGFERAERWTWDDYLRAIDALARGERPLTPEMEKPRRSGASL
jgi:glycosyltransferase involved in cell wall biosynthesis